jgi:uncharacterized protein (DUF4415 family)
MRTKSAKVSNPYPGPLRGRDRAGTTAIRKRPFCHSRNENEAFPVSVRLDADVLACLKSKGEGHLMETERGVD